MAKNLSIWVLSFIVAFQAIRNSRAFFQTVSPNKANWSSFITSQPFDASLVILSISGIVYSSYRVLQEWRKTP